MLLLKQHIHIHAGAKPPTGFDFETMAGLEVQLVELTADMNRHTRKWADCGLLTDKARSKQTFLIPLADALMKAQIQLDDLQALCDNADDKVDQAVQEQDDAKAAAKEASVQVAEHVGYMYRLEAMSDPK